MAGDFSDKNQNEIRKKRQRMHKINCFFRGATPHSSLGLRSFSNEMFFGDLGRWVFSNLSSLLVLRRTCWVGTPGSWMKKLIGDAQQSRVRCDVRTYQCWNGRYSPAEMKVAKDGFLLWSRGFYIPIVFHIFHHSIVNMNRAHVHHIYGRQSSFFTSVRTIFPAVLAASLRSSLNGLRSLTDVTIVKAL